MRGGAREHNILQLDDKQVPDIHDNRHRHKETGDSTRTKKQIQDVDTEQGDHEQRHVY